MTGLTAYTNARLIDPASKTDVGGAVLIEGNKIIDWGPALFSDGAPENVPDRGLPGLLPRARAYRYARASAGTRW